MKSALNPKQVRHQNRRARQKAKKQFFNNTGENIMETTTNTTTTNNQETNDIVDITVTTTATEAAQPSEPAVQMTPEQQEFLDKVNALVAQFPEEIQVKMKAGEDVDYDSLTEIEQLRMRQILELTCEPVAKELFGPFAAEKADVMAGLINEVVNIMVIAMRKQMSEADRKAAIIQHLDFIFALLPPVPKERAQAGINEITKAMGIKIDVNDLKTFQSPEVSNAEVREESNWVTGSNMFIGGAVVGTVFNMLTQGVTITNGLVGVATAGAGWLAKDKINEMVEDSTVKLVGAGVAGAGITIGGTMALDAIRAKLRNGSGVTQEEA